MKNFLLVLMVASVLGLSSNKAVAQFEKGDKLVNLGIGGGGYGFYSSGFAVGGSIEYGIHDFISVGAQADLKFYNYGYIGVGDKSYVALPIAARGSYHYGKHFLPMDNLDLYAGPTLGFSIDGNKYYTGGNVVFGAFAGARYYFKPALGVFLELAGGTTSVIPAKVGVTFKL
ncbi:hypothetical protein [Dyadobacter tibetensis]|uniref:hypothetical protein n=1 Tax=Dyadobacter tibetensis TaxID=1211851 RepID=UPI00046E73A0|nr:hypothetical protein [Dyadobacter tibetensis]